MYYFFDCGIVGKEQTKERKRVLEIQGRLSEMIYQNEVNSYTIATLDTEDEEVTIVGYLPFIHIGDTLKLIGQFVTHQEYGEQFKIDSFEKMMPQTRGSIRRIFIKWDHKRHRPIYCQKNCKYLWNRNCTYTSIRTRKISLY